MPGAEQSKRVEGSVLIIWNIRFLHIIKCLNFPDFPGWTWFFPDFPAFGKIIKNSRTFQDFQGCYGPYYLIVTKQAWDNQLTKTVQNGGALPISEILHNENQTVCRTKTYFTPI